MTTDTTDNTEPAKLRISITTWLTCSGATAHLYYAPEDHEAYVHTDVGGNSWPMMAHNKRHMGIAKINTATVPDAVRAWVEEHTSDLEALRACYKGTTWNGNNYIGQWEPEAVDLAQDLGDQFAQAELPTYWNAEEYFGTSWDDVITNAIHVGSIDTAVELEVEAAASDANAMLEEGDACKALTRKLEQEALEQEEALRDGDTDVSDPTYYLGLCKLLDRTPHSYDEAHRVFGLTVYDPRGEVVNVSAGTLANPQTEVASVSDGEATFKVREEGLFELVRVLPQGDALADAFAVWCSDWCVREED